MASKTSGSTNTDASSIKRAIKNLNAVSLVEVAESMQGSGSRGLLGDVFSFIKENNLIDALGNSSEIKEHIGKGLTKGAAALLDVASGDSPEVELGQLLKARAWKEIATFTVDVGGDIGKAALSKSFQAYKTLYDIDPNNRVRAGLNLIALSKIAETINEPLDGNVDQKQLTTSILSDLNKIPQAERGADYFASRAQAHIAQGDLGGAEKDIGQFVRNPKVSADDLRNVTRQIRDVWRIGARSGRGVTLVQSLTAAILTKDFGIASISPDTLRQIETAPTPTSEQLETIFGSDGPDTYQWFLKGCETAKSVGIIRMTGVQSRVGTGFIIRGGDVLPGLGDEPCVLTNSHVVSSDPLDAAPIQDANEGEILFEAVDKTVAYKFSSLAFCWPRTGLDAAILRFGSQLPTLAPLTFAKNLPLTSGKERVYVIGYPGGGELSFSLQNSLLLDHEGPPQGKPTNKLVRRVQYQTPTEKGSSGSPVFNAKKWGVIALHHAGDEKMKRLNGLNETWEANEGIWIQSICEAGRTSGA